MKSYTVCKGIFQLSWLVLLISPAQAQNALSSYLLHTYTPIPDHASYYVPGGLIEVNYHAGTYSYFPPQPDAAALVVQPSSTSLPVSTQVTGLTVNAAVEGFKFLFGIAPAVQFENDAKITFSGVDFTGFHLDGNQADQLIVRGPTHDKAAYKLSNDGLVDIYLITEVLSTKAASISSDKDLIVNAGTGGSSVGGGSPPTENSPPASATIQSVQSATEFAVAGLAGSARVGVTKTSGKSVQLSSAQPVPTAMRLRKVIQPHNAPLQFIPGDVCVPLYDPAALHHHQHHVPSYSCR